MIQSPAGYQGDVRIKRYLDFYQAGYGVAMLSSGVAFSPLSLFAQGEQGGWYDPSDLTTMFQDAAGTTAAALESPVGLVLDKSKGLVLGSELVTNGDFSNGTTGWTAFQSTLSVTNGVMRVTENGAQPNPYLQQSFAVTSGRWYKVSFDLLTLALPRIRVWVGSAYGSANWLNSSDLSTTGAKTVYFLASGSTAYFELVGYCTTGGTTEYFEVDNISVRELPGNHLSQSTSTARPVLSARANLLTYTEDFSNSVWDRVTRNILAFGSGSTVNATTAPNGTTTADLIVPDTSNNVHYIGAFNTTSLSLAAGTYKLVCYSKPKPSGYSWISLQLGFSGSGARAYFDVANGAKGTTSTYGSGFSVTSYNIFPESNDFYRCEATITSSSASIGYAEILVSNGDGDANLTFAGNGTKGIYIWGADLRPSNAGVGLPAYQRVGAATSGSSSSAGTADYDATGFPYYLRFDGTDDFLQSASIDFSATDKMSVWAGVRKLSDSLRAIVAELSAGYANTGTFGVEAPANNATANYSFVSGGSIPAAGYAVATGFAAPITNVLTGLCDISGDNAVLRVNSTEAAQSTTNQGTGNFGNYPLYVGSRNGSGLRFNGHLYSLIVRGAATDAATLTSTETWVNGKTKAF